ncbi:hypothetical protein AAVH_38649 [Aphelenchoides avenae]|nr:hypothetical protein AAVH_38649 [Aphelenchus avenae]
MAPRSPKDFDAGNTVRNLTLKARVDDAEEMETAIFNLTQTIGNVAVEEDVYFNVPYGQMKLRTTHPGHDNGELISYKQSSNPGANLSEARVTPVDSVKQLRSTLAFSLSELGTIRKRRRVYGMPNVRINLDDVHHLGLFVDIDIRADTGLTPEELQKKMDSIKQELGIKDAQLVSQSYLDLYRKLKSADSGFDDESNSDASA